MDLAGLLDQLPHELPTWYEVQLGHPTVDPAGVFPAQTHHIGQIRRRQISVSLRPDRTKRGSDASATLCPGRVVRVTQMNHRPVEAAR